MTNTNDIASRIVRIRKIVRRKALKEGGEGSGRYPKGSGENNTIRNRMAIAARKARSLGRTFGIRVVDRNMSARSAMSLAAVGSQMGTSGTHVIRKSRSLSKRTFKK